MRQSRSVWADEGMPKLNPEGVDRDTTAGRHRACYGQQAHEVAKAEQGRGGAWR